VSDDNLNDPQARASRNEWYLYYDRSPAWGGGAVRAVIEVVTGHRGMYEPQRTLRHMFINQAEAAVDPGDRLSDAWAPDGWIPLSDLIIDKLTDEEFDQLIANGTLIPLRTP
jgi:hypothetical protein